MLRWSWLSRQPPDVEIIMPKSTIKTNKQQHGGIMSKNLFIRVDEMVKELQISKPYAYKLMREMNEDLKKKGFMTIAGRVSRKYYEEKFYGIRREDA